MEFSLVIDPRALGDIQRAIDYYDEQQNGLGKRFEDSLHKHLLILKRQPFFSIRYGDIHCLPMKKFPYMIHYSVDEAQREVVVMAIFNTSRDPKIWGESK